MIKWRPFELHTHTLHSDALHVLKELANNAKTHELEGIQVIGKGALDALYNGRMIVTLGPIIELWVESQYTDEKIPIGGEIVIDDTIETIKTSLELHLSNKNYEWNLADQQLEVSINGKPYIYQQRV